MEVIVDGYLYLLLEGPSPERAPGATGRPWSSATGSSGIRCITSFTCRWAQASSSRHGDPTMEEAAVVDFIGDQPLDALTGTPEAAGLHDGATPTGELNDHPLDFGPHQRTYRARPVYRRTLHLPAAQRGGLGTAYLTRIHTYLDAHRDDLHQEADA
ncbi:hypothetical protein KN815_13395 [Streptomyces sp. 4503]|uniref:Uncharacterized protein n=1 Tax=Streptomyces niphimycinicus TaxID=2842201 RepID=A0ABS6CDS5_9ACTN|nr:hypothetical protein [Streptomyces niphimycinicus]MBU3865033.1 hypothetical protein [Streptomyces niphimycinicus]